MIEKYVLSRAFVVFVLVLALFGFLNLIKNVSNEQGFLGFFALGAGQTEKNVQYEYNPAEAAKLSEETKEAKLTA